MLGKKFGLRGVFVPSLNKVRERNKGKKIIHHICKCRSKQTRILFP